MNIRSFDDADTPAVIALWQACGLVRSWNDPHRDIARKCQIQRHLFLVGEERGAVIASLMAGYEGHRGWLNYLAVDPMHQRRGHAVALVREIEGRMLQLGCPKLSLQVRAANHNAIAFYRSIGYIQDDVVSFGRRLIVDGAAG